MSTVGKNCLDNIWKLLGQPTYDKLQMHKNNEEEEWAVKHQNKKAIESKENV